MCLSPKYQLSPSPSNLQGFSPSPGFVSRLPSPTSPPRLSLPLHFLPVSGREGFPSSQFKKKNKRNQTKKVGFPVTTPTPVSVTRGLRTKHHEICAHRRGRGRMASSQISVFHLTLYRDSSPCETLQVCPVPAVPAWRPVILTHHFPLAVPQ